jgi:acid phosphatase (class A)
MMPRAARLAGLALLGCAAALAYAEQPAPNSPPQQPRLTAAGYLPRDAAPDVLALLPPPPEPDSAAIKRDEEATQAAMQLRETPRWDQAVVDADLFTPNATGTFSCAAGLTIGPETTPRLDALLRKAGPDLAMAVYPAKRRYQRPRPFMVNGQPTCTPKDEAMLRGDGSYPSGHSAIGYGWGLILAEVMPDRTAELVARGRSFGESRRVCNVHWLSDVEEGRVVAAAVVARLHAEAAFRTDLAAARAELTAKKFKPVTPGCDRENAAFLGWGN